MHEEVHSDQILCFCRLLRRFLWTEEPPVFRPRAGGRSKCTELHALRLDFIIFHRSEQLCNSYRFSAVIASNYKIEELVCPPLAPMVSKLDTANHIYSKPAWCEKCFSICPKLHTLQTIFKPSWCGKDFNICSKLHTLPNIYSLNQHHWASNEQVSTSNDKRQMNSAAQGGYAS